MLWIKGRNFAFFSAFERFLSEDIAETWQVSKGNSWKGFSAVTHLIDERIHVTWEHEQSIPSKPVAADSGRAYIIKARGARRRALMGILTDLFGAQHLTKNYFKNQSKNSNYCSIAVLLFSWKNGSTAFVMSVLFLISGTRFRSQCYPGLLPSCIRSSNATSTD